MLSFPEVAGVDNIPVNEEQSRVGREEWDILIHVRVFVEGWGGGGVVERVTQASQSPFKRSNENPVCCQL